jgi:hypothetical protein
MAKTTREGNAIFGFKPITLLSKNERWRRQAKALKLQKNACLRLEWLIYYETKAKKNALLTCRHFGISKTRHSTNGKTGLTAKISDCWKIKTKLRKTNGKERSPPKKR